MGSREMPVVGNFPIKPSNPYDSREGMEEIIAVHPALVLTARLFFQLRRRLGSKRDMGGYLCKRFTGVTVVARSFLRGVWPRIVPRPLCFQAFDLLDCSIRHRSFTVITSTYTVQKDFPVVLQQLIARSLELLPTLTRRPSFVCSRSSCMVLVYCTSFKDTERPNQPVKQFIIIVSPMHRSFGLLSKAIQKMFILGEKDVVKALDFKQCLEINRQALITISEQTSYVPTRLGLPYPNHPNSITTPRRSSTTEEEEQEQEQEEAPDWTLIKPAAYYGPSPNDLVMGMKVISVRAQNPANHLPLTPATILLFDPISGIVESTVAGTQITIARTSAGPALAVLTFRPDVQHLVVFGAGAQAKCHIKFIQLAIQRTIPKITIINRTRERAEQLRSTLLQQQQQSTDSITSSDQEIQIVLLSDTEGTNNALQTADVVAATTNATEPVFDDGRILPKNCLITGIGSYTPEMTEIPSSAVDRCHVIIDTPEAMAVGDLKHLGGTLDSTTHPVTLAGEAWKDPTLIVGGKDSSPIIDCIFYKAVGTAIQDVLTTRAVVQRAKELGLGQQIDMS